MAMTRDDFDYAIENTHVIVAPEQQIATFGSTSFNFYLISELMDRVDQVRIRNGKIHAERPQILTPEHYCRLLLEGFGEKAERYADLKGFPPVLIQVGSAETLLDDATRFAAGAGAAAVRVTLEIRPQMIHAWPLWNARLEPGRRALASAGAFIRQHL